MTVTFPDLSRVGRIGNQLWQVASTIGIASSRAESFSFPAWDYQPFFNLSEECFNDLPGTPATELVPHLDPRAKAYLQDFGLWSHCEPVIRDAFRPSPEAAEALSSIAESCGLEALGEVISVHIRRGDNVTHPLGYHPLRSMQYYRDALALLPDLPVVVFSDDITWCREHLEQELGRPVALFYEGVPRPREYVDRARYESAPVLDWVDLQLMAKCSHHVISNSTYAWWGAFLSEDPAPIYPARWFGRHIKGWTDASLMFPPHWRQVNDPTQGGA